MIQRSYALCKKSHLEKNAAMKVDALGSKGGGGERKSEAPWEEPICTDWLMS